ncbi:molybdopterin biosynthesis protein MoeB [Rubripirellula lacrimiformis]|uniref:Molybdopterin biosynthesis protein MoeB n=1 Tax=Rubripirellula lacrimiformis TaxID=1930273 RepID=A0A517NKS3_9BACT|nr:rhodanese-like domain-containing protein [Rubripirellula lacrimiformis]QDT07748.1 molybdopterin biosynthesis protein MoeB [Rubripirellula lacrimiformis]
MPHPTDTSRRHGVLGKSVRRACDAAFATIERGRRLLGRPPVRSISTEEVRKATTKHGSPIVLVDVRDDSEQRVSRIPGSISLKEFNAAPNRHRGKTIVPYCTIGGRSYLFARRLVAKGFDAQNYRDSILGWVHCGLPLETPTGQPTNAIHPYWSIFQVPDAYRAQK